MSAELGGQGGDWPKGYGLLTLEGVDSTNSEGFRRNAAPLWIIADEQTAARGRRARPWASMRGNFYASLILAPDEPAQKTALRSFIASLALRAALADLIGPQSLDLKWPNDVLLNGGKVAGILLERHIVNKTPLLAIGIGVNLIAKPDITAVESGAVEPVSVLSVTGKRFTPMALLERLAPAYAAREAVFKDKGFAPIRLEWLTYAARLGDVITARTMQETHVGRFETIDDDGNLILIGEKGRLAITAADVFF